MAGFLPPFVFVVGGGGGGEEPTTSLKRN